MFKRKHTATALAAACALAAFSLPASAAHFGGGHMGGHGGFGHGHFAGFGNSGVTRPIVGACADATVAVNKSPSALPKSSLFMTFSFS